MPAISMPLNQPAAPGKKSNGAFTQSLNQGALTSNRLKDFISKDSDFMKRAETKGLQLGQKRGLLNSGMSIKHAENAVYDAATPVAQADAQATLTQSLANQGALNDFGLADKNNAFRMSLQKDQQGFSGKQSALDRGQSRFLQSDRQSWQSGESALGREHAGSMQDSSQRFTQGENRTERDFRSNEAQLGRDFQGVESNLSREHNGLLQDDSQAFSGSENILDRTHESIINGDNNAFRRELAMLDKEIKQAGRWDDRERYLNSLAAEMISTGLQNNIFSDAVTAQGFFQTVSEVIPDLGLEIVLTSADAIPNGVIA